MTTLHREALVPYTPYEMYELVRDIAAYPQFLPWCRSTQILEASDQAIKATIELAKGGIHKSFTTIDELTTNETINIRLVDGPFSKLHGTWQFNPLGDTACKVALDMHFEFSNKILAMAIGPVFSQIVSSLVDAFVKRARQIYGPR